MNTPAPSRNTASVAGFKTETPGVIPPASRAARQGIFLTDVIVELGFAEKAHIGDAEDTARLSGKTVEQVLLDNGVIDEHQLSLAIAERHGLDHVDLDQFEVDMRAAESIGRSVADRCGAVPIAFSSDGALIVAVQDAGDLLAVRRIETSTGKEVRPAIARMSAIKRLIEALPEESAPAVPSPEVPRITSQRELQVDAATEAEAEVEPEAEPEPEPRNSDLFSSFDGLSMDLGPMTMEDSQPKQPAEPPSIPDSDGDASKREKQLARELIETKGKVAEFERRLEEVMDATEEATAVSEKLRALRSELEARDSS